jgi:hypothetical protein
VAVATLFGPAGHRATARALPARATLADEDAAAGTLLNHQTRLHPPIAPPEVPRLARWPPTSDRPGADFVARYLADESTRAVIRDLLGLDQLSAPAGCRCLIVLTAADTRAGR